MTNTDTPYTKSTPLSGLGFRSVHIRSNPLNLTNNQLRHFVGLIVSEPDFSRLDKEIDGLEIKLKFVHGSLP